MSAGQVFQIPGAVLLRRKIEGELFVEREGGAEDFLGFPTLTPLRQADAEPGIHVRVLAATNRDLAAGVEDGDFRRDLYYRLNVFPVKVPPLRERIDDIPLLAEYLLERYAKKAGKKITAIDRSTLEELQNYDWPGNVRELQNVVERAVIFCETPVLSVDESWFRRDSTSRTDPPISFNAAVRINGTTVALRRREAMAILVTAS